MPRDTPWLTPSPRPLGLGNDLGRLIGALAIGLVLVAALWFGLPGAVEAAIREGLM